MLQALGALRTADDVRAISPAHFEAWSPRNVYDLFCEAAAADPAATAMTFMADVAPDAPLRRLTRGEVLAGVTQAANLFTRLGIGPRDTVALLLPILPESHMALWGAATAGIALPANFLLTEDHLVHMLRAAGAKVLVAYGPSPGWAIWDKVAAIQAQVPTLESLVQIPAPDAAAPVPDGVVDFHAACAQAPAEHLLRQTAPGREDVSAYFHTGGTTGLPKLACQTHGNQLYTAWACTQLFGYGPADRLVNGFPIFHVAGSLDFGLAALAAGTELVLPTPAGMRNPAVVADHWRMTERLRPTILAGVPTSMAAVLATPVNGADISSAGLWITGGSPLPVELAAQFERTLGMPVREIYGMTETTGILAITPADAPRVPGAAGMALPLCEIRVVQPQTPVSAEAVCATGQSGLVLMRGPNVIPGYSDSSLNADIFTGEGWLITGDLGYLDAAGYLHLTGRAKDVIIRGGHNIDPLVIEEAAQEHPAVLVSAAVGQPDAYAGEIPVLYVAPKPGQAVDPRQVQAFVGERVQEPPARPKAVYVLDALPMTAIGKVFKPELRLHAAGQAFAAALAAAGGMAAQARVETVQDAQRGLMVRVTLPAGATAQDTETVRRALSPFAATCEITRQGE